MKKDKKKLWLASVAGLAVLGSIAGNRLAKDDEFLSPPPHAKSSFSGIYRR